jgi:hypothetical protein
LARFDYPPRGNQQAEDLCRGGEGRCALGARRSPAHRLKEVPLTKSALYLRAQGARAAAASLASAAALIAVAFFAAPAARADAAAVRTPDIAGVALHPWRMGPDATPIPFWPLRDPKQRERIFSAIQAMGVKHARVDLRWYMVEPWVKGVRDWNEFDAIHSSAQAHGVTLLPMVAMPPAWANGGGGAWRFPRNPKDFEDFLTAAIERYPDIPAWEIWNEPNLPVFSQPAVDPAKFVALLEAAHNAKLRAGSSAQIVSGGLLSSLNGTRDFFEAMVKLHAFDYVDGFGIHPYSPPDPMHPSSAFLQVPWFHDRLEQIGKPGMGIWITEYGASTSAVNTEYGPPMNGAQQADRLRDAFAIASRWPWVKNLTWYEFEDLCSDPLDVMCNFGLVHDDLSPKPSSAAMGDVVRGDVPKLASSVTLRGAGVRKMRAGRPLSLTGRLGMVAAEQPAGAVTLTLSRAPRAGAAYRRRRAMRLATGDGRFATTLRGLAPGRWRFVATYPGSADYDASRSDPVTVVVKPRRPR